MAFTVFSDIFWYINLTSFGNSRVYTMFITNNHASFHLWWKENLAKHQKASKYYENDCRYLKIGKLWIGKSFLKKSTWKINDSLSAPINDVFLYSAIWSYIASCEMTFRLIILHRAIELYIASCKTMDLIIW